MGGMIAMNEDRTNTIRVYIPSEWATLKKVVMCFPGPGRFTDMLQYIDAAFFYQLWHNKIDFAQDIKRMGQQQEAFMEVLKANGVEILLTKQVPRALDQIYTRDVGFAIDDAFFPANPRRRARQRELEGLRELVARLSKVVRLESGTIEGGDVIVDEKYVIVGLGEETDREGISCLRRALEDLKTEREVVVIEFKHRGIIHLDTKFNIVGKGVGLIHPKSFRAESLKWLENHFDLIEATDQEAANVEINTFTISPRKVVMSQRSHRLASLLESRGIEPILIDYSEVNKLPGSFRCTTLPIERADSGAC
jgi:N-dimethylarginine dimethylaminohydrolase